MRKVFWIVIVLVAALALFGCVEQRTDEINIGYSALRISEPVFVAAENGYFEEQGLKVNLVRFDTAQPLMDSLVAGNIDVAGYTALPITYNAMSRSKTNLYFVSALVEDSNHQISYFLVPKDSNNSLKDAKGKTIGVLPTIAYKKWAEVILQANGINKNEVTITPIDPSLQLTALSTGQVNYLFTNDPVATTIMRKGIGKALDETVPKYLGEPMLFGSFNISERFVKVNPEKAVKIIAALDKAIDFITSNPVNSKQITKKYVPESQKDFVDFYSNSIYLNTKLVKAEDFQKTVDQYLSTGIIDNNIQLSGFIWGE
jgi:NitT/TauT family transport system substrate-binding protein